MSKDTQNGLLHWMGVVLGCFAGYYLLTDRIDRGLLLYNISCTLYCVAKLNVPKPNKEG
jgi:hypothetical protein